MVKLMPVVATMTNKGELSCKENGSEYSKICVALEDQFYWCAVFGATARYIEEYANVGAKLFLEDWTLKKNGNYYDFQIRKLNIVKNGGDK